MQLAAFRCSLPNCAFFVVKRRSSTTHWAVQKMKEEEERKGVLINWTPKLLILTIVPFISSPAPLPSRRAHQSRRHHGIDRDPSHHPTPDRPLHNSAVRGRNSRCSSSLRVSFPSFFFQLLSLNKRLLATSRTIIHLVVLNLEIGG